MPIGQSQFPNALDTVKTLVQAVNDAVTTLTGPLEIAHNSAQVNSTAKFGDSGFFLLGNELLSFDGKTPTSLLSLTHGEQGTTPAAHNMGVVTEQVITAADHNVLVEAILEIETKLGIGADTPGGGAEALFSDAAGASNWRAIAQADVSGLVAALAGKQPLDADLTAIAALSGAGFARRTGADAWAVSALAIGDLSFAGAANGVATLDGGGKVPSTQLPSYVDDVLEFANLTGFPGTGETGKIYVPLDTGKTYRWSGSAYVEISTSEVNSVFGRTGVVVAQASDYAAFYQPFGSGTVNAGLAKRVAFYPADGAAVDDAGGLEYQGGSSPNVQIVAQADDHRALQIMPFSDNYSISVMRVRNAANTVRINFDPQVNVSDAVYIDSDLALNVGFAAYSSQPSANSYFGFGSNSAFGNLSVHGSGLGGGFLTEIPSSMSIHAIASGGLFLVSNGPIVFATDGDDLSDEKARILNAGHWVMGELGANPSLSDLADGNQLAIYRKSDKLIFAFNLAGTINYLTIPLDGSTSNWTQSTTAP